MEKNRKSLEEMDEDTYHVIGVLLHEEKRFEKYKKREKREVSMCIAIDEMIEEGRNEGRNEGIKALIEICEELGLSREETFSKVKDKFELQEEHVEEYLNQYWK